MANTYEYMHAGKSLVFGEGRRWMPLECGSVSMWWTTISSAKNMGMICMIEPATLKLDYLSGVLMRKRKRCEYRKKPIHGSRHLYLRRCATFEANMLTRG